MHGLTPGMFTVLLTSFYFDCDSESVLLGVNNIYKQYINEETEASVVTEYINELANTYFEEGSLIHVFLSKQSNGNVSQFESPTWCNILSFIRRSNTFWHVVLTDLNYASHSTTSLNEKPEGYIVTMNNYQGMDDLLLTTRMLSYLPSSYNPEAKFLFICIIEHEYDYSQLASDAMNYLWKRNILRLALLILTNKGKLTILSAAPFSNKIPSTCREASVGQLQSIERSNFSENTKIQGLSFKIPTNFQGCSIVAFTYPFPPYTVAVKRGDAYRYLSGIEIEIVGLLAERYNITVHIRTPDLRYNKWSDKLPNGTHVGMMVGILNYEIDLVFAGAIPSSKKTNEMDQINGYIYNHFSWYVPNTNCSSHFTTNMHVFHTEAWIALALVFLFVVSINCAIQKIRVTNLVMDKVNALVLFGLALGVPGVTTPRSIYLRFMFISWLLYNMLIVINYNTILFSVVTEPDCPVGITSLEELDKSTFKTCLPKLYLQFYINITEELINKLLRNAIMCNDLEKSIERFVKKRDFSLLVKEDYLSFIVDEHDTFIHKLSRRFLTYPVTMTVSKGNAIRQPLSRIMRYATDFGLITKWKRDAKRNVKVKLRLNLTDRFHKHDEMRTLIFEDLLFPFYILFIGQSVGLFALVIEIVYSRYSKTYMEWNVKQNIWNPIIVQYPKG